MKIYGEILALQELILCNLFQESWLMVCPFPFLVMLDWNDQYVWCAGYSWYIVFQIQCNKFIKKSAVQIAPGLLECISLISTFLWNFFSFCTNLQQFYNMAFVPISASSSRPPSHCWESGSSWKACLSIRVHTISGHTVNEVHTNQQWPSMSFSFQVRLQE